MKEKNFEENLNEGVRNFLLKFYPEMESDLSSDEMVKKIFRRGAVFSRSRSINQDEIQEKDMGLVQEILQREGVFSTSKSKKPILATYGIGPCVAVIGYCKELGRGFVTHYDSLTDKKLEGFNDKNQPPESLELICNWGTKGVKDKVKYDIQIIQGSHDPDLLNRLEKYLENINNLHSDGLIQLNVKKREIEDKRQGIKSIALDLRNGKTFSYNPLRNNNRRDLNFQIDEWALMFPSPLKWVIDETLMNEE